MGEDLLALLRGAPLIDGHNDLLYALRDARESGADEPDVAGPCPELQTDLPRLAAGGLGGQFWSVYVRSDLEPHVAATRTLESRRHAEARGAPILARVLGVARGCEPIRRGQLRDGSAIRRAINAALAAARLPAKEIDHVLVDANPRGIIRHSSMPVPTVQLKWQLVLDNEPLDAPSDSFPEAMYDPEAVLALVYTSGTTGRPKGVVLTHANILANLNHVNYWMPYREGGVYLHAAPIFHIADFPFLFGAAAFGALLRFPEAPALAFFRLRERTSAWAASFRRSSKSVVTSTASPARVRLALR